MERPKILVLDGDASRRATLHERLGGAGVDALAAAKWSEAVRFLRRRDLAVVHVDVRTPGVPSPGEVLDRIAGADASTAVVLAGVGRDDDAAALADPRAFDVTPAHIPPERSAAVIQAAVRHVAALHETRSLRRRLRAREGFDRLVGRSPSVRALRERVEALAAGDDPVLFVGEPGTGRSLASKTLHERSARATEPFVVVHVESFPRDRLAMELFGDPDGGYRGAVSAAGGGTVHLAGAESIPVEVQRRIAAIEGPRITASTLLDPVRAEEEGRFDPRWTGLFRHGVVEVPPLRDRLEDVPLLSRHFLDAIAEINGLPSLRPSAEFLEVLAGYPWPGNVLEMRNALEQAAILADAGRLDVADLPERVRETSAGAGPEEAGTGAGATFRDAKRAVVQAFERRYLDALMARHGGNVTAASQEAGMLRSALQRLLRKHRLRSADYREGRSRGAPSGARGSRVRP